MAGHGGSDDEAAGLSLAEVQTNSSRTVVDTSQIGLDDLIPLLNGGIEDTAIGCAAGVGNEDIDLAKVLDDVGDQLLNLLVAADIAFICLGLDAVLLRELFGVLLTSLGTGGICDGNIGTHLSTASSGFGTDTRRAGGTGDNDDLALQAEEVMEGSGCWDWDRHFGWLGGFISMGAGY